MPYTTTELNAEYPSLFKIYGFDKFYKDGRYTLKNDSDEELCKAVDIDKTVQFILLKKARISKTLKMYFEIDNIVKRIRFKKDSRLVEVEKELSELIKYLQGLFRQT